MRFKVVAHVVAGLVLFASRAASQVVRGITVENDRPIPGVIVLLVDSAESVAGRSLTNAQGEFQITAPRAGTYRLRTLRIGFRPVVSESFTLAAGATASRRLALVGVPVALDTMRVVSRNACRAFADSAAAVFRVWEQVRGALIAAELTAEARTITATTVTLDQVLDVNTGRPIREKSNLASGVVARPWRTLAPDSLRRAGYVLTKPDNTIEYHAPGLDMLASNLFVEDHCFSLVEDARANRIGITFEPTPDRRRIPEIRGTMWVDRTSSELKRLELRYANLPAEREQFARAELAFVRLRDGAWAVSSWRIRMPVVEQFIIPGHGAETRVTAIQVNGGELALARRGTDTIWMRPRFTITVVVRDSATNATIGGARVSVTGGKEQTSDARGRVALPDILPGQHRLEIRTPSLDSMNTAHRATILVVDSTATIELRTPSARSMTQSLCGNAPAALDGGLLVGRAVVARDSTGRAIPLPTNAIVTAEWSVASTDRDRGRRLTAPVTTDGAFRLCGLPLNADVALTASAPGFATAKPRTIRVTPAVRLGQTELELEPAATLALRRATFTGIVVFDSTRAPIEGAEVVFPDLGLSARSDAGGGFRVEGIVPGEHRVTIRRVGFGAADTRITFEGSEALERRVVLGRAVTLEAMTVTARSDSRFMPGFDDNRRVGLGHFMTREDLEKYRGMRLMSALQNITAFRAIEGRGGGVYPRSSHAPVLHPCPNVDPKTCAESQGAYYPEAQERARGIQPGCYALVFLDGTLMNGYREPVEPFDIGTIPPESVEAIEFYAGPAQTPPKYTRMGARCGVLVIWSRKS